MINDYNILVAKKSVYHKTSKCQDIEKNENYIVLFCSQKTIHRRRRKLWLL